MQFTIRTEQPTDYDAVSQLIQATFADIPYSDHREQILVDRLRKSAAFVPDLSLVAEGENGVIAGHVLLTKIKIQNDTGNHEALALAPLSVSPGFQNKGIGSQLVHEAHRVARVLGYHCIVILGIPHYYQKFGYQLASKYHLKFPIKIDEENAFVISLTGDGLDEIRNGTVIYAKEFFG